MLWTWNFVGEVFVTLLWPVKSVKIFNLKNFRLYGNSQLRESCLGGVQEGGEYIDQLSEGRSKFRVLFPAHLEQTKPTDTSTHITHLYCHPSRLIVPFPDLKVAQGIGPGDKADRLVLESLHLFAAVWWLGQPVSSLDVSRQRLNPTSNWRLPVR